MNDKKFYLEKLKNESEKFWLERGEKMALDLFHSMSKRVPAYKDFLLKNSIDPDKIVTTEDFKSVPLIDKDNYLRKYDLNDLCWDGNLQNNQWTISSTSGSTGEPFYFPRTNEQNLQYALVAELYLLTNFSIDKKSTLYIDAFPMGPWIGGVFTYETIRIIAERGKYSLSIITPGINKMEVINVVNKFANKFDQIIIGAYGPFLKDILDDATSLGFDWSSYNIKFIFSAEVFSEKFREYVLDFVKQDNIFKDTLNHYGTVDMGTMSYETPLSILLRRTAIEDIDLYKNIFGDIYKLPTFTQYIPELFYFEQIDDGLVCSSRSGLPLVRYDLKDRGGVYTFSDIDSIFGQKNFNIEKEAKKADIIDSVWKLPYVYVYERKDFSVSLYAFNIYPETIRRVIELKKYNVFFTGKFTMLVNNNNNLDQVLTINVELKNNVIVDDIIKNDLEKDILNNLILENSEYRETYKDKGYKIKPHIVFWQYGDNTYFKSGTKQKWIKK